MLADSPEKFILHLVPDLGVAASGLVQKLHHHPGLVTVSFGHVGPDLAGVLAGSRVREKGLFLVRSQVKVVAGALVQVQNYVQVCSLDVGQGLVQKPENFVIRSQRIALEQVEVVHRQSHVVESRLSDALEIFHP